jgi:hypothetical protein
MSYLFQAVSGFNRRSVPPGEVTAAVDLIFVINCMERNIFTSQGFLDKRAYQILRNKQSENQNSEKTGRIISIIKPYDWLKPDLITRLMTEAKSVLNCTNTN